MLRHLFLYGTLQPEINTPMARWLAPKLRRARRASVSGRMIAIPSNGGYYPALLAAPDHRRVQGTLAEAVLSPQDWRVLDRYEGAEYRREPALVCVAGIQFPAHHYRWTGAMPPNALPVASGDFARWLSEIGADPYRAS